MSLLDLFGKDANFFGGRTSEQRARGAGQIAYESIPGISEAVTFRDIKSELKKDKPNYFTIGLLAGAGALGLLPFVGDIAGSAIRQGVKARNAVNTSSGVLDKVTDPIDRTKTGFTFKEIKLLTPLLSKSENRRISQGMVSPEIVTLPIRRMNAQQGKVNPDFDTTESSIAELPLVYKKNNELFVSDGHHRLTKLASEGHQNAKVRLVDLDPPTTTPLLDYNPNTLKEDEELLKELGINLNLTPAQQQSQDIINLLKSGKANEVTDQMLAKADQKYLFENYDLPMDTQSLSERAKGMGLLDDSFHGTTSAKTTKDGIKKPGGRLFSSSSPEVANTYGDNIYPLKIRKQDSSMTLDAKGRNWSRIPDPFDEMYSPDKTNFSVDTLTTLPSLSTDIDMSGGKSLTVKNVVDAGAFHTGDPKSYKPSTVTVSHMKNNPLVRSRFARFDPRLKHLKNLSAGFIPIGLLPFLMNEEQQ